MGETRMVKPIRMYFPIERVNDEERTVEGYCFCNEVVRGEGGIRLKRSAMEEAAPSYMEFPTIREMHRTDGAAGTVKLLEFDQKGARIRAKIVDDQAWAKVKEGVYRGFSIGVIPTLMRGKDVTKVDWVENSLVDRPADPDAVFTVVRSEKFEMDKEYACDVEPKEEKTSPPAPPRDGEGSDPSDKSGAGEKVQRRQIAVKDVPAEIQRLESETVQLKRTVNLLKSEVAAKDAEIADIRRAAGKAAKRAAKKIDRLSNMPVQTAPVLFPGALRGLERTFNVASGPADDQQPDTAALQQRYNAIIEAGAKETNELKRTDLALELNMVKQELNALGVVI